MTTTQLILWYQKRIKEIGKEKARQELWDLKYNRTVTSIVAVLVDERGNELKLKRA